MQLKKELVPVKESTKKEIKSKVKKVIEPKKEVVIPENIVLFKELLSQSKAMTVILETTQKELLLQQKEVTSLLKALKERFV